MSKRKPRLTTKGKKGKTPSAVCPICGRGPNPLDDQRDMVPTMRKAMKAAGQWPEKEGWLYGFAVSGVMLTTMKQDPGPCRCDVTRFNEAVRQFEKLGPKAAWAAIGYSFDDDHDDDKARKSKEGEAEKGDEGVKKGGFSTPRELLDVITGVWVRRVKKGKHVRKLFVATMIGTVAAAKLLVRLSNEGELLCKMDPEVVYRIETLSDEFAVQLFDIGGPMMPPIANFLGETAPLQPRVRYLQVVKSGTDWHWTKKIDDIDSMPMPPRLVELLEGTAPDTFDIMIEILGRLGKLKSAIQEEKRPLHAISELVALFAAAKMCLSVWGNAEQAAYIEYFAESASKTEYDDAMQRPSPK